MRDLGGLHVIGSERHESRRIDNQLRGRSARQGDPGSSRFYLSMEDELMRLFGGQQAEGLMQRLRIDEAMPLEVGLVGRIVEQSQTRVEGANFDVRKHLLEYDDVLNTQRAKVYEQRNRIFTKDDLSEDVTETLQAEVNRRVPEALGELEGPWKLLAWLDQVQPTLPFDGYIYPSYTLRLLLGRILARQFGQAEGIEKIADAQALDVISLGTDQDAQENFNQPERQDPRRKGAGGVPVRSEADYRALYAASRRGNFPLLRTYSGTDDFIRLAGMYVETIKIAWCAIPLFWFNQMDGRGPWDLEGSIREHQQVMQWYGGHDIPVELNEPHHWGMRDAQDVVFIVSAYLSAYNAHAFGVKDYIAQLMFNQSTE